MEFKAKFFEELSTYELYDILKARCQIFTVEQRIICLDPDGVDHEALHCILEDSTGLVAYLRGYKVSEDTVKIGRVLSLTHGIGHGSELMRRAMPEIVNKFECNKILVHAQKHAEGFYSGFGFKPVSEDFMEEGVPHVAMELILT